MAFTKAVYEVMIRITAIGFEEVFKTDRLISNHFHTVSYLDLANRGSQPAFVYVFEKSGRRVVYAPCDIKPFPEHRDEVQHPDLLIIQPGIFEEGLKHGFHYPLEHISRTTLYTFDQTMRLQAKRVLFVHLEEYWNRTYDDYRALESQDETIRFAYDGMQLMV